MKTTFGTTTWSRVRHWIIILTATVLVQVSVGQTLNPTSHWFGNTWANSGTKTGTAPIQL